MQPSEDSTRTLRGSFVSKYCATLSLQQSRHLRAAAILRHLPSAQVSDAHYRIAIGRPQALVSLRAFEQPWSGRRSALHGRHHAQDMALNKDTAQELWEPPLLTARYRAGRQAGGVFCDSAG